jgi:hypothetical protein
MDILGIGSIIGGIQGVLNKFIHSPEDKARANLALGKIQHSAVQNALKFEIAQVRAQADVIMAEAKNGWLSRSWRPILMFVFMAIIINNFLIWPYSMELGITAKVLEFPVWMQDLLKLGVGGYIGGRSAEKIIPATVKAWKGSKSE